MWFYNSLNDRVSATKCLVPTSRGEQVGKYLRDTHTLTTLFIEMSHTSLQRNQTQHTLILDYVLIELHSCPKLSHGSDSYKCSLRDHNSSTSEAEWGLKLRLEQDGLVPPSSFVSFIWCSKTYGSLLYALFMVCDHSCFILFYYFFGLRIRG